MPSLSAGAFERCGAAGKTIYRSKDDARKAAALPGQRARRHNRCAFWHVTRGAHNHGSGASWKSA